LTAAPGGTLIAVTPFAFMADPVHPPEPLTLFFADDHKIVRDGLRVLAEREPGFRAIGEAANGRALVEGVLALRPDVVVTDMTMPDLNGLEAVRQLRAAGYKGVIVMFSVHDERRFVAQALAAGVNAYVHKEHAFEHIIDAIRAARRGETWLSPELRGSSDDGSKPLLTDLLTQREIEVLQLLAEGHGTKEVAHRLKLSPKTIETHRLSLLSKLRAGSVVELAHIAVKEGIIRP
jgi:DNA-binding NarL/FixJ family response regulator